MFSQGDEEEIILAAFAERRSGRLLDIGAYDGRTFSNTLRLIELGWGGVLVEPSPAAFVNLCHTHAGREGVTLLQAAVGFETRDVAFFDSPDAVGTTSPDHAAKWSGQTTYTTISVPQVTIPDLLEKYGTDFDFVSIDTESTSGELFVHWPFNLCQPKVFCVEHDGRMVEMAKRGRLFGYEPRYLDDQNLILFKP